MCKKICEQSITLNCSDIKMFNYDEAGTATTSGAKRKTKNKGKIKNYR